MIARLHDEMTRWLAAEAADDVAEAETAFNGLFATVPRLAPRAGFTERVLWAVRPEPAPRLARAGWAWKSAAAAALALGAMAAGLLPLIRWLPIDAPTFGSVVKASARGVAWVADWLDVGLATWQFLAGIGGALGVAATTPQVATALLTSALVGAFALYGLNHLLVIERRTWR